MPNHVTNVIEAPKEVISSMLNDEGFVDFCKAVPKHPDLDLDNSSGICLAAESAAELMCQPVPTDDELLSRLKAVNMLRSSALEMSDGSFEQFVKMMRNKRKHGFFHSMHYAREAWGTKWNAYDQSPEDNSETKVKFSTAWSHPFPVIEALSKRFPDAEINVKYADEDTGSNCGSYTAKGGEIINSELAPSWNKQSEEERAKWTEFAFTLCHPSEDPRGWGYGPDWKYSEDVESEYYEAQKTAEQQ